MFLSYSTKFWFVAIKVKPLYFTFIKLPTNSFLMCVWTAAPFCWMLMYIWTCLIISLPSAPSHVHPYMYVSATLHNILVPIWQISIGLWAENERWIYSRHTDEVIGLVRTNLPRLSNTKVRPKPQWPNLSKEKLQMRPESQGQLMTGTCLKHSWSQAQLTHYIWRHTQWALGKWN